MNPAKTRETVYVCGMKKPLAPRQEMYRLQIALFIVEKPKKSQNHHSIVRTLLIIVSKNLPNLPILHMHGERRLQGGGKRTI